MQVVEHDDDRTSCGCTAKQGCCGVEKPEPCTFGVGDSRLAESGKPIVQLRKNLAELRGSAPEPRAQIVRFGVVHEHAERLHPRPERRRSTRLPAASNEDGGAARPGRSDELVSEPALPDPRLSADEHDASATCHGLIEALGEQTARSASRPTNTPRL